MPKTLSPKARGLRIHFSANSGENSDAYTSTCGPVVASSRQMRLLRTSGAIHQQERSAKFLEHASGSLNPAICRSGGRRRKRLHFSKKYLYERRVQALKMDSYMKPQGSKGSNHWVLKFSRQPSNFQLLNPIPSTLNPQPQTLIPLPQTLNLRAQASGLWGRRRRTSGFIEPKNVESLGLGFRV